MQNQELVLGKVGQGDRRVGASGGEISARLVFCALCVLCPDHDSSDLILWFVVACLPQFRRTSRPVNGG